MTLLVNLALIPRYGVDGAIYATLSGYAVLGLGQLALCPTELRAWPDARALLTALALGALLAGVAAGTDLFGLVSHFARFAAVAPRALALFVVPAVLLDPVLRGHLGAWRRRGSADPAAPR